MRTVQGHTAARGVRPTSPASGEQPVAGGSGNEQSLGETVRRLRSERQLSVRTLANRAGFSPSFISQVERNQASPSIASLERLAGALGVTLGQFFRDSTEEPEAVTRAAGRQRLTSWWSRARVEALSPMHAGRRFEAVMITLAAGGSSGKRPHAQRGEEFVIVFEGEVRLTLGSTRYVLGRGDTVSFEASTPRRWENPARTPARLVIVSSRLTH